MAGRIVQTRGEVVGERGEYGGGSIVPQTWGEKNCMVGGLSAWEIRGKICGKKRVAGTSCRKNCNKKKSVPGVPANETKGRGGIKRAGKVAERGDDQRSS